MFLPCIIFSAFCSKFVLVLLSIVISCQSKLCTQSKPGRALRYNVDIVDHDIILRLKSYILKHELHCARCINNAYIVYILL